MQTTLKVLRITLFITLIGLLTSCGAIVKGKARKYATVEKGAIPADFGKEAGTVLFVKGRHNYTKYLKRNLRKAYKGDYQLINPQDIEEFKYANASKYPYVFDYILVSYSYRSDNTVIYGPPGGMATRTVRRFVLTDRKNGKKYSMPMTSGFWSKLQRVYLQQLEAQRVKNVVGL